jgi:hypothetical protein
MFSAQCPVCSHVNPEDSKFCNACGVPLARMGVCSQCGALNELSQLTCHQCDVPLRGSLFPRAERQARLPPPEPETEPEFSADESDRQPALVTRHHAQFTAGQRWVIAGTAVAVVLAASAYLAYVQLSVTNMAGLLPVARSEARIVGEAAQGSAAVVAPASVEPPATPGPTAKPALPAAAIEVPPLAKGAPAAAIAEPRPAPKRSTAGTGTPSGATQAAQPPAPPTPERPGNASLPPRVGPCTAAVAALGLCNVESTPAKE